MNFSLSFLSRSFIREEMRERRDFLYGAYKRLYAKRLSLSLSLCPNFPLYMLVSITIQSVFVFFLMHNLFLFCLCAHH